MRIDWSGDGHVIEIEGFWRGNRVAVRYPAPDGYHHLITLEVDETGALVLYHQSASYKGGPLEDAVGPVSMEALDHAALGLPPVKDVPDAPDLPGTQEAVNASSSMGWPTAQDAVCDPLCAYSVGESPICDHFVPLGFPGSVVCANCNHFRGCHAKKAAGEEEP
ncbi:MAG: hypothetical protein WC683_01975 [bacterium]